MKSTGITNQELIEEIKGLRRVVINTCYGGFGLSVAAIDRYNELAGTDEDHIVILGLMIKRCYSTQFG